MHDTKPWYTSVTIWGSLVSVLASALSLFKIHIDPQLQADLRDWLLAGATLAGGAAALWGRLRASRRILSPAPKTRRIRARIWCIASWSTKSSRAPRSCCISGSRLRKTSGPGLIGLSMKGKK